MEPHHSNVPAMLLLSSIGSATPKSNKTITNKLDECIFSILSMAGQWRIWVLLDLMHFFKGSQRFSLGFDGASCTWMVELLSNETTWTSSKNQTSFRLSILRENRKSNQIRNRQINDFVTYMLMLEASVRKDSSKAITLKILKLFSRNFATVFQERYTDLGKRTQTQTLASATKTTRETEKHAAAKM